MSDVKSNEPIRILNIHRKRPLMSPELVHLYDGFEEGLQTRLLVDGLITGFRAELRNEHARTFSPSLKTMASF